jgi:hypothetical protein
MSDESERHDQAQIAAAAPTATFIDPLMAQMRSILNLGPRASDPSQRLGRRYSDTDRPSVDAAPIGTQSTSILSADGSRRLPAPDEQSERYNLHSTESQVEAAATEPVAPHICTASACALEKVLETPELLEITLTYLDTADVLNVQRTSKLWHATIHQSPQLRLRFFTYGQYERHGQDHEFLQLKLPGLSILPGEFIHLGRWVTISMTSEAASSIIRNPRPRVRSRSIFEGLRGGLGLQAQRGGGTWPADNETVLTASKSLEYEDLFVSQPPLFGMQAYLISNKAQQPNENKEHKGEKNEESQSEPAACAKIWCEAGITLGFLAETAQSILASNDPQPSDMADAKVEFKAIMSFTKAKVATKKRSTTRSVVRMS